MSLQNMDSSGLPLPLCGLWPGSIRREWPGSGAVRALDKKIKSLQEI